MVGHGEAPREQSGPSLYIRCTLSVHSLYLLSTYPLYLLYTFAKLCLPCFALGSYLQVASTEGASSESQSAEATTAEATSGSGDAGGGVSDGVSGPSRLASVPEADRLRVKLGDQFVEISQFVDLHPGGE